MTSTIIHAQAISSQISGSTDVKQVSDAITALNDLLLAQREEVNARHKMVNAAKADEDDAKITLRRIEALTDAAKRQRQELRDERYRLNQ